MNLIKRTIILSGSVAEGYLTVIRVGDDVGAKIVGGNFAEGMCAGLRIGDKKLYCRLTGQRTEINIPDCDFKQNDNIGCAVLYGENIVAKGGIGVRIRDIVDYFAENGVLPEKSHDSAAETGSATKNLTENLSTAENTLAEPPTEPEKEENIAENNPQDEREDVVKAEQGEKPDLNRELEKLSLKEEAEFYRGVRDKIDELFVIHPREEILKNYLAGSEWVKVKYDGEDYYVVGKIAEEGRTVLIGYGVPGKKNVPPPKAAADISNWLDVPELKNFDGYWLIFQDAATGKVVPAE